MVHPGGRPRTVSFAPDEMVKLGEEMIEWVKLHDPLHLSEWYSIEKRFTSKQWDAFQQLPEFFPYYETALFLVGKKYLDKSSKVRDSISHRWQRVYFKDLKRLEDQDLDDAAKRASRDLEPIDEQHKELLIAAMELIKQSQSSRKSADNNNNKEAKS